MSGFGIREQWEAGKRLADPKKPLWRPASFLQQMSLNGSLLLVPNHDQFWIQGLAEMMDERGRGWTSLSARLRAMPGSSARKLLWRSSYRWWRQGQKAYPALCELSWRYQLDRPEELLRFERSLARTAVQLEALAWCEYDVQREPIDVVELERASEIDT